MRSECMYTFLCQESCIFVLKEVSRLMKIGSRKILGIPLVWMAVIVSLTIAAAASGIIISNILGPYRIHVIPETNQLLTISLSNPPQSQAYEGSSVKIDIKVSNPTSSEVVGYIVVNITASDFTLSEDDVLIYIEGVRSSAPTAIPGGYMYKSYYNYSWDPGETSTCLIEITFNKANPTDNGYYEVTIGITSS